MANRLRVLDLFSGIGGISLGLERTGGFETVAFCEIEPFPREVLAHHWPGVPIHGDVRTLTTQSVPGGVDVICGGFPCQPFSVAGKQKAQADERHLWPHFARLIREFRPRWVLAENVPGIRTLAADEVIQDLEAAGYTCWPLVVGADDVGASHRRKRVWFVAHRTKLHGDAGSGAVGPRWPARPGEPQHEWEEPRLAYGESGALRSAGQPREGTDSRRPEQPLGGAVDGLPERLVRRFNRESLKALGNSVVPQVVEGIGYAILEVESGQ